MKLGAHTIAARVGGAHLRPVFRFPWLYTRVVARHLSLPSQGRPGTHLSIGPEGKINSWVGCSPTGRTGIRTQARRLVIRGANRCIVEVPCKFAGKSALTAQVIYNIKMNFLALMLSLL